MGDGTFERVTDLPVTNAQNGEMALWADISNDGSLDLYVGAGGIWNWRTDLLFLNDGDPDLFITNGTGEPRDFYYLNTGGELRAQESTLLATNGGNSIGASFADFDNDDDLDLYVTRFVSNLLYRNDGPAGTEGAAFTNVTSHPLVTATTGTSMGVAWGDYDNDGFLDLFTCGGGNFATDRNELFQNRGNDNHWLKVKCVGTRSNRSAIGAKLRLRATIGGRQVRQRRDISAGSGLGSQNSLIVHFGLGDADEVESLEITWPSGTVQTLEQLAVNQLLEVVEPPAAPFRISSLSYELAGRLSVTWPAVPGETYAIELATPDQFAAGTWIEHGMIDAQGDEATFTVEGLGDEPTVFVRVKHVR